MDTLGSGGTGKRAIAIELGGGQVGVAMAFSGQVAKVLHHLCRRINITKSPCSTQKYGCKEEGLGGHLQKGTLSLLSSHLGPSSECSQERGLLTQSRCERGGDRVH